MSLDGDLTNLDVHLRSPHLEFLLVCLRSHHVDYLQQLSTRAEEPLEGEPYAVYGCQLTESHIIAKIIERSAAKLAVQKAEAAKKARKNFSVRRHHVDIVNEWARRWGVKTSQVVQRLIEQAAADNFRL